MLLLIKMYLIMSPLGGVPAKIINHKGSEGLIIYGADVNYKKEGC